jgi:hypothetical protein
LKTMSTDIKERISIMGIYLLKDMTDPSITA